MESKAKIILMGMLLLFSVGTAFIYNTFEEKETTDAIKFKEEYEALNGQEVGTDAKYTSMDLPENNPMVYSTYEEVFEVLEGTGVVYFGYPECPWCRNLVPTLIESAKKVNVGKIYYINLHDDRDQLELDENGDVKTVKEGNTLYHTLVEKLYDVLPAYEGLNDESIKRIYVPFVVFVKDGSIVATHTGTVDSQENPFIDLTEEEKISLKQTLVDKMLLVSDSACDDLC